MVGFLFSPKNISRLRCCFRVETVFGQSDRRENNTVAIQLGPHRVREQKSRPVMCRGLWSTRDSTQEYGGRGWY